MTIKFTAMNTVTIKVSPEVAKKFLASAEGELAILRKQYDAKSNEVEELKRAVNGAKTEVADSLPLSVEKNPASGRARKGQSDKAILSFLNTHRGASFTQSDLAEKTGTSMSTAGRVLKRLSKSGHVDRVGNNWGVPA